MAVFILSFFIISCGTNAQYIANDSSGNQCKNECNTTCVGVAQLTQSKSETSNCVDECYSRCYTYNGGTYTESTSCFLSTPETRTKDRSTIYQPQYSSSKSSSRVVSNDSSVATPSITPPSDVNKKGARKEALEKAKQYINNKFKTSNITCKIVAKEEQYNNGKRKSKKHFCEGHENLLMGLSYTYYGDGISIKTISSYYNGQKDGYWFEFDLAGNLKEEAFYKEDAVANANETTQLANPAPPVPAVQAEVSQPQEDPPSHPKNQNCFFDEATKKQVCCELGKALDKKTKKLTTKYICDNNTTLDAETFD